MGKKKNVEKMEKKAKTSPRLHSEVAPYPVRVPEKVLFNWTATARPFKRRNRDFYVTIVAIAAVVGLVVFLIDGWMPVLVIISLVFLYYVMSTVEPEMVNYKITNYGLYISDSLSGWEGMLRFWFSQRFDSQLLIIETVFIPSRIELVVNAKDKKKIEKILSSILLHEEAPPGFLDKTANWLSKKLPES